MLVTDAIELCRSRGWLPRHQSLELIDISQFLEKLPVKMSEFPSADIDHRCLATTNEQFQRWLAENRAVEIPILTQHIDSLVDEYAPITRKLLKSLGLHIRVAKAPRSITGRLLLQSCDCGKPVAVVVISAAVMLYIWRTMSTVAGLVTKFEDVPGKIRVHFRHPADADVEQLRIAVEGYFGDEEVGQELLGDLLRSFGAAPIQIRGIAGDVISLGELFVVFHEVAHAARKLGLPSFVACSPSPSRPTGLSEYRAQKWHEEVSADLDGLFLLATGFSDRLSQSEPESDVRQIGLSYSLAGAATAMEMIWLLEAKMCANRLDLHPFVSHEFCNHPPTEFRRAQLKSWGSAFAKSSEVVNPWWIAESFTQTSRLLAEALANRYPTHLRNHAQLANTQLTHKTEAA